MSLEEYWKSHLQYCSDKNGIDSFPEIKGIPVVVAPLVAAEHEINMSVEEVSAVIRKFREIDDVTRRLTVRELDIEKIEKVIEVFQTGCTYSKEVITETFQKEEVAKQYHELLFPESNA